jgi:hypothetical protein
MVILIGLIIGIWVVVVISEVYFLVLDGLGVCSPIKCVPNAT